MNEVGLLDLVVEEELERDPDIMFLATSPPQRWRGRFGDARIRVFPISEQAMVGSAIGASLKGMRPIVDLNRASFLFLVMDQLVNHAGRLHYMTGGRCQVPMVVTSATRGQQQLGPQNEQCPYGVFMQVPGLAVAVPGTLADACGLLRGALRWPGPVLYFVAPGLARGRGMSTALRTQPVRFGVAARHHSGEAATIVAIGSAVAAACAAADALAADGVHCDVLDPRTLVPLDVAALADSVRRTGRLVIADDGPRSGAPVQILGRLMAEPGLASRLKAAPEFVCLPDVPVPSSPALEELVWATRERVIGAVIRTLG